MPVAVRVRLVDGQHAVAVAVEPIAGLDGARVDRGRAVVAVALAGGPAVGVGVEALVDGHVAVVVQAIAELWRPGEAQGLGVVAVAGAQGVAVGVVVRSLVGARVAVVVEAVADLGHRRVDGRVRVVAVGAGQGPVAVAVALVRPGEHPDREARHPEEAEVGVGGRLDPLLQVAAEVDPPGRADRPGRLPPLAVDGPGALRADGVVAPRHQRHQHRRGRVPAHAPRRRRGGHVDQAREGAGGGARRLVDRPVEDPALGHVEPRLEAGHRDGLRRLEDVADVALGGVVEGPVDVVLVGAAGRADEPVAVVVLPVADLRRVGVGRGVAVVAVPLGDGPAVPIAVLGPSAGGREPGQQTDQRADSPGSHGRPPPRQLRLPVLIGGIEAGLREQEGRSGPEGRRRRGTRSQSARPTQSWIAQRCVQTAGRRSRKAAMPSTASAVAISSLR